MKISKKLRQLRISLGLSQANMGGGILSTSSISRIEKKETVIFADDLLEILRINGVSVVNFLKEYSTVEETIKQYEDNTLYYFLNKDLDELKRTYQNKELSSRLLNILTIAMIQDLQGELVDESAKVKKLLFKFQNYDDNFLWCLLVSLRVYQKEDFSQIVEKVILKLEGSKLTKTTQKLFADVLVAFLVSKGCQNDTYLQHEVLNILLSLQNSEDIFLQKIVGAYLLAKQENDLQKVEKIKLQISLGNLTREFNQLLNS